jgi:uncharacterized protein YdeI (YjbR/CyaY-like superfamily)
MAALEMQITKTLYVQDAESWRKWLSRNHNKEKEIWLIYYKKSCGKKRIPYNDAVEEALSFGWIDSTAKKIDEEKFAQRFTPRNPKSPYSEANKARLRHLAKEGKIIPEVLAKVKPILSEKYVHPKDILAAIRKNKAAWVNFRKFSPNYRRIRIAYVDGFRDRPDYFKKALANLIKQSEKNKQIGFGGIEKYY